MTNNESDRPGPQEGASVEDVLGALATPPRGVPLTTHTARADARSRLCERHPSARAVVTIVFDGPAMLVVFGLCKPCALEPIVAVELVNTHVIWH